MLSGKPISSLFIFDHDETFIDNYEQFVGYSLEKNFQIITNVSDEKDDSIYS
jgi:hypothetical protein